MRRAKNITKARYGSTSPNINARILFLDCTLSPFQTFVFHATKRDSILFFGDTAVVVTDKLLNANAQLLVSRVTGDVK
jgi:hypothetical protein